MNKKALSRVVKFLITLLLIIGTIFLGKSFSADNEKLIIEGMLEKYINYNLQDGESGTLVQYHIRTGIEYGDTFTPINNSNLEIDLSSIDGVYPDSVKVITTSDGWRILFNADHRIRDGVPAERWYYLSHDLEIERDPEGALYAAHPELQPPTWDDESHLWVDYKGDPVDPQPDPPSYSMYWDEATQTWYWYSDNTPVDPQPDPPETETP